MKTSILFLYSILLGQANLAKAPDRRFVALFSSGEIVHGKDLRSWNGLNARPTLDKRLLFDAKDPVRWVIDTSLKPASLLPACVELHGGDRVPGRVIAYREGNESPYEQQLPHVLLEPQDSLDGPEEPRRAALRISVRWVRRILWERRGSEVYRPGTLYFRDRRVQRFRSLRWGASSVRLLLADGEATGTLEVSFSDIAELHLPRLDSWDATCEQLAILDPEVRSGIFQLETGGGLRVTGSPERFRARSSESKGDPGTWVHGVVPAWSPDALWIYHRTVRVRRYFLPGELPLTLLEPATVENRHVFGSAWSWQRDQGSHGGPLRVAGLERGFGIGVHAQASLEFDLPPLALSFRTLVGIDESVGRGGCARASIAIRSAQTSPADRILFRSPLLMGSQQLVDSLWHDLQTTVSGSSARSLVLIADSAQDETPSGVDPFDIRDAVDWIEPTLRIDKSELKAECRKRMVRLVAAWKDWNLDSSEASPVSLRNRMARDGSRWWMDVEPALPFLRLTRRQRIPEGASWLCLSVTRDIDREKRAQISLSANGKMMATQDVPGRFEKLQSDPMLLSLRSVAGTEVDLEIVVSGTQPQVGIEWAGIGVVELPPGLARLHAGAEEPGERSQARFAALQMPIRERPLFGEYRFIRFEWRAVDSDEVSLVVGHDGPGKPELEGMGGKFRYVAGPQLPSKGEGLRVENCPPATTRSVVRDLYKDLGAFTLNDLEFKARRGRVYFQNVYLARSKKDFEWLNGDKL